MCRDRWWSFEAGGHFRVYSVRVPAPTASARIQAVQAPVIPIIGRMIRETPGTISLGQGMVWYGPPPEALARLTAALDAPDTHTYREADGIPALVAALGAKLAAENGIAVAPGSRLMVTAGANLAFLLAILAVTDPGDEVILPSPFYFNHEMAIVMAGARPVPVPTGARYNLQPDRIRAAITGRTRAIVTVSPNNPSGAVYPEADLHEVNAICRDHRLYHLADEVYEHFTYGRERHFSPRSIPGAAAFTFTFYSFSKDYGLAGWRVGYMVMPAHLHLEVTKAQDTALVCPPVASQLAALGALAAGSGWVRDRVAGFATVRELVLGALGTIPDVVEVPAAAGAFYLLLRVRTALDPMTVVERLIREHRVAVVPGSTFGIEDGCSLRVSYGGLEPRSVAEGIGRLVNGLRVICRA